nr:hypothetical protein CFP56_26814 [Quercus suber]
MGLPFLDMMIQNEVGFSLSPSLKIDTEGKPDANLFGKPDTLPGLAINKKKNAHSIRDKKIFARNSSFGNPLSCAVTDPSQVFAFKLTSLSTSTSISSTHGSKASQGSSFKFMASIKDGLDTKNGWGGNRNSSGDQRRVQSKDYVHDAVIQPKGEGSLGFEVGGAGMLSDSNSKKGSDDRVDEDDRMVPKEEGETKSSF